MQKRFPSSDLFCFTNFFQMLTFKKTNNNIKGLLCFSFQVRFEDFEHDPLHIQRRKYIHFHWNLVVQIRRKQCI